jgi:hypothetical protein
MSTEASVGATTSILADDLFQRRALADEIAEGFGFDDGFLQVTVLKFELFFEAANFVERARIRDGRSDVIREDLAPTA